VVKDGTKACAKVVYEDDFSPTCSNGTDHTIAFIANIYKSCKLYATVVGNGEDQKPSLCELDVYINEVLAHHASLSSKYIIQSAVQLLSNRGKHNVTIVGRQLQVDHRIYFLCLVLLDTVIYKFKFYMHILKLSELQETKKTSIFVTIFVI